MLELEVYPGESLANEQWQIVLGMPFLQVVNILREQYRTIQDVEVWYNSQFPLKTDIVLSLSQDGIRFLFDPAAQRLKVIEVKDMSRVILKYNGVVFNTPVMHPTPDAVEHCFGATVPGECCPRKTFSLNYRGLTFNFPCDFKNKHPSPCGLGSLQCCKETCGVLSNLWIYSGNTGVSKCRVPALPSISFCGSSHLELLQVLRVDNVTQGIRVALITETGTETTGKRKETEHVIKFGDSSQFVASALGTPDKVFYKPEDKMKIHSTDCHKRPDTARTDYFYNYFTLGLDILFNAHTHQVKKFILHTNYPGHFNFNIYCRCQFRLAMTFSMQEKDGRRDKEEKEALVIDTYSKWSDIKTSLQLTKQKPVIKKRTSTINTSNPFGSTYFYGVQDIIFEVMENEHISSVTLYQSVPSSCSSS